MIGQNELGDMLTVVVACLQPIKAESEIEK
jgi:hypothetical protein